MYAVFNYGFVVDGGGYVIGDDGWPTNAPQVMPFFETADEAWDYFNTHPECRD